MKFLDKFRDNLKDVPASIKQRLILGSSWSLIGSLVNKSGAIFASILVARALGVEAYGEYGMVRSTVGMFLTVSSLGMGAAAASSVARLRFGNVERLSRVIAMLSFVSVSLSLVTLAVFLPNVDFIASDALSKSELAVHLSAGSLLLATSILFGFQQGVLTGFEAFREVARVNAVSGVLYVPALAIAATKYGVTGAIIALGAIHLVGCVMNQIAIIAACRRHSITFNFRGCMRELPLLWTFNAPIALSGILVAPTTWVCQTMLVGQPNGYEQIAYYEAANQWRMAVLFVPALLANVLLPVLVGVERGARSRDSSSLVFTQLVTHTGIALLFSMIISAISPLIMTAYGAEFSNYWPVLVLVLLSAILLAANNVLAQWLVASERVWMGLVFNAAWAAVFVLSSWILVDLGFGAYGLAGASLLAYVCHTGWQLLYWNLCRKNEDT